MNKVKQLFGGDVRQLGMVIALIVLMVGFHIWTGGFVITPDNFNNILQGNAYVLVLAIGMVLVIIAGHIDLSVGSVAAFVGICVAIAMRDWGLNWFLGILLGLALGALVGTWQGFWVARVGIPAFIVTLAGMLLFRGANQFVGKSNSVPVPDAFVQIGAGTLPEVGPNTGYNNLTVLLGLLACVGIALATIRNRAKLTRIGATTEDAWITWTRLGLIVVVIMGVMLLFASGRKGFPYPGLILIALVLIYGFIANRTITGRHIYAVGGNRLAAELSGVKSRRINFLVMANMSVLAALAGMMFVARSTSSGPADGVGWELDAIAAVFIGGAAVSGGVGTVVGSMVGGLVMAVLNNGLQLKGIGADLTSIIKGFVLLAAVAFDIYNKMQGKPSITGLLMRRNKGVGADEDQQPPPGAAKETEKITSTVTHTS